MTITGQSSLDKDAIDQMVKDAEAHAADDAKRKEEAEVRNRADTLVYQTEKLLREQGEKMSDEDRSTVDEHLSALKAALGTEDLEAIGKATETLMTSSQEFTQKLYEQAAAAESAAAAGGGGAGAGASGSEPDDAEVVDAEIVDDEEA